MNAQRGPGELVSRVLRASSGRAARVAGHWRKTWARLQGLDGQPFYRCPKPALSFAVPLATAEGPIPWMLTLDPNGQQSNRWVQAHRLPLHSPIHLRMAHEDRQEVRQNGLVPTRDGDAAALARQELAEPLCAVMAGIHRRGWCEGTGGNFSCVLLRDPLTLLMAPSGVDKGAVTPGQLIEVDGQQRVVNGRGKASAETLLHLEIVRRTGAGAVLHSHSQAGTLISALWEPQVGEDRPPFAEAINHLELTNLEMLKGLAGVTSHKALVRVPVLANDQDLRQLSDRASPHLAEAPHGLLISGHGLYAWGMDLWEAKRHLEIHEFLLEQQWRRLLLSGLPQRPSQRSTD
jgi:methylthioribulose-1-phosphate dehydratase